MQDVIIKPIISEKSLAEAARGRYTFLVKKEATKPEVLHDVQILFHVTVMKVRTSRVKGTKIRFTRKGKTTTDLSYKKARVQLKKGEKIEIFEEKKK